MWKIEREDSRLASQQDRGKVKWRATNPREVTVSVGTALCPYGRAYRSDCGLSTCGLYKKSRGKVGPSWTQTRGRCSGSRLLRSRISPPEFELPHSGRDLELSTGHIRPCGENEEQFRFKNLGVREHAPEYGDDDTGSDERDRAHTRRANDELSLTPGPGLSAGANIQGGHTAAPDTYSKEEVCRPLSHPLSSEHGTHKTVEARFRPWLTKKGLNTL